MNFELNRRQWGHLAFGLGMSGLMPMSQAQNYPSRPIKLVVPFPPGGSTDVIARMMAQKLAEALKVNVVVENKAGVGSILGTDAVAKSAPDGHTLVVSANPAIAPGPLMRSSMPYDAFRDFTHLALLGTFPNGFVVRTDHPAKSMAEFIAMARARPGVLNYASAGLGSSGFLTGELLKQAASISMVHVPYKGSGPALTDLIGGQVQYCFETMTSATPHVKSGKAIALAQTRTKRAKGHPNVPTMDEQGFAGFDATTWYGLVGPAKLNPEFIKRINEDMNKVMAMPDVIEKFDLYGAEDGGGSPERFAEFIRSETQKWAKVIKDAKVQADS